MHATVRVFHTLVYFNIKVILLQSEHHTIYDKNSTLPTKISLTGLSWSGTYNVGHNTYTQNCDLELVILWLQIELLNR